MTERLNHFILQQFKNWMLPIAMLVGGCFYSFFAALSFLTPYLIFMMLLIPYSKLSLTHLRVRPLHYQLLAIQIAGSLLLYVMVNYYDPLLAQGTFICMLAPTATSAAVITGMLGGSVTSLVTYTLMSNLTVALCSPLIFSFIGENTSMPLHDSMWLVAREMIPLLVFPMAIALLLKRFFPQAHDAIRKRQQISFYLWAVALTIVTGRTINFLVVQDDRNLRNEIIIALAVLGVCVCQFMLGRFLGKRYGNRIAGGQGLGQKNTILAIWMAQTYLTPLSSIGPAAYVVWQNSVNSWQLWKKRKKKGEDVKHI